MVGGGVVDDVRGVEDGAEEVATKPHSLAGLPKATSGGAGGTVAKPDMATGGGTTRFTLRADGRVPIL